MPNIYTNNPRYRPRRRRRVFPVMLLVLLVGALLLTLAALALKSWLFSGYSAPLPDADLARLEVLCRESGGNFQPSEEDMASLKKAARENARYREELEFLIEHVGAYSQDAVNTAIISPEKTAFVLMEPFADRTYGDVELTAGETQGIPFFLQYDARWAFHPYGSSVMGYTACGPTCLSMAAVGLTSDGTYDPVYVSDLAEAGGYYVWGVGTSWLLFTDGAAELGLTGEVIAVDRDEMCARLDAGEVLIASMTAGDFTKNGHFIVIYDHTLAGFRIYDPSSAERSGKTWSFQRLSGQTAQIWSISK